VAGSRSGRAHVLEPRIRRGAGSSEYARTEVGRDPGRRPRMSIRPILRYGESLLHTAAAEVTTFDGQLRRLIDDMIETMYAAPGVGLAATQVGVPLRVFVIDLSV